MTESRADCLFCRICDGDVPATILRETDRTVAFRDVDPQAPLHALVVPREHHASAAEAAAADPVLIADLVTEAANVARAEGLSDYRLVTNTGPQAGQSVFHVHVHVLGGRQLHWPPG